MATTVSKMDGFQKFKECCNPYHPRIRMIHAKIFCEDLVAWHSKLLWYMFCQQIFKHCVDQFWNTENNGGLTIKIGPEIRKLCHILPILKLSKLVIFLSLESLIFKDYVAFYFIKIKPEIAEKY